MKDYNYNKRLFMETFKDISGYEGKYQISNKGTVKSLGRDIVLRQQINTKSGHLQVVIWRNSRASLFYVHRLVAEHFVDNPHHYKYVTFKDGNKTNVVADNLYWVEKKPTTVNKNLKMKSDA